MADYVESLSVQNFGCIKQAELKLTPLHALIGPNDSGKSTLLAALHCAIDVAGGGAFPERYRNDTAIEARAGNIALQLAGGTGVFLTHNGSRFSTRQGMGDAQWVSRAVEPLGESAAAFSRGARLVRLDPRRLRLRSALIPHGQVIRIDEHGPPLAGIVDALATRNVDWFIALRDEVRGLFPTVANISLNNVNNTTKELVATLKDGTEVAAEHLSDGLLYYMAFRALTYLDPVSAVLIEEPENGLHPSRIAEVMKLLREISKCSLVVVATHSPLVVNELSPSEVSVVTRTPEHGTKVTPIATTPHFAERSKVYALGELWLSYANGTDEAPLLKAPGKPQSAAE